MVSAEDVARVAVGLLLGPAQPKNTVLPLVGGVVTIRDMVAAFSETLGKPIQYREITDDQWVQNVSGACAVSRTLAICLRLLAGSA